MIVLPSQLDISSIKLIIWDLDNTFWSGVLSEGEVVANPQAVALLKESSRRGIVNSICSKNDYSEVEAKLRELGIWDLFVFPSIDWTPKRDRLFGIIHNMGLRPANVLFLDDEPYNLAAVSSYDQTIMCSSFDDLSSAVLGSLESLPVDDSYKRLIQYRGLQKKNDARHSYNDDHDFLKSSKIHVRIGKDCVRFNGRIKELIIRTNQLNFTKKRLNSDQVDLLLNDSGYDCGYIEVRDKFCDYGIVGFYALRNNSLEHFLFSCRTIGMGIEQFVYSTLGYPQIDISGEVVTTLSQEGRPDWIQMVESFEENSQENKAESFKILLKGPCDVSQILPFFKNSSGIRSEFSYVSRTKHTYIESQNHLSQIFLSQQLSQEQKDELAETLPFIDPDYFHTDILSGNYDYVIISVLPDYGLGLYRNKHHHEITVPFNQYTFDYTKKDNWIEIMNQQSDWNESAIVGSYDFFVDNYEFIGRESDESFIRSLTQLRDILPHKTRLVLVNGAEYRFNGIPKPGYEDREVLHKHLNELLVNFSHSHDNIFILDVNSCINGPEDYLDTLNHYKRIVYYRMAHAIQEILDRDGSNGILNVRKPSAVIHDSIRSRYSKLKGHAYKLYSKVKNLSTKK